MNEPGTAGTSATGARSQLMPSARSSRPVSSPWRCDSATGRSPSCGGAMSGGAQASRLTAPPSWSTQTSGAGAPPARAATRILAVSARTWSGVAMFRENSTTPPADPVRSCVSNEAGAVVPWKATISRCPTRRASGTGGGGGGAGALLEGGGDVAGGEEALLSRATSFRCTPSRPGRAQRSGAPGSPGQHRRLPGVPAAIAGSHQRALLAGHGGRIARVERHPRGAEDAEDAEAVAGLALRDRVVAGGGPSQ